jgi:serine/threonine-protein kinase
VHVALAATVILTRRNLRLGRGDRRGAYRLAVLSFVLLTLAHLSRANHTTSLRSEFSLLILLSAVNITMALWAWLVYMALEPAVRRRWPHMLIGWSRLLAGRFKDPLVGRDVLLGVLAGVVVVCVVNLAIVVPAWLGRSINPAVGFLSVRSLAYLFFRSIYLAMLYALGCAFLLYLVHTVIRRPWAAYALLFLLVFVISLGSQRDPLLTVIVATLFAAITVTVVVRLGVLALATCLALIPLAHASLTLDLSAWYAGRSLAMLGFYAALACAAFYVSLGGKPLFGRVLLED